MVDGCMTSQDDFCFFSLVDGTIHCRIDLSDYCTSSVVQDVLYIELHFHTFIWHVACGSLVSCNGPIDEDDVACLS